MKEPHTLLVGKEALRHMEIRASEKRSAQISVWLMKERKTEVEGRQRNRERRPYPDVEMGNEGKSVDGMQEMQTCRTDKLSH